MAGSKKDLSYYLSLRYPCELSPCKEVGFFARYPDLDGCASQGDSVEDTLANLQVARELWLEGQLDAGAHVPEPPNEEPSGRLMLRVPLRLHAKVEREAAAFGLSLNRWLNEVLLNYVNRLPYEHGLEHRILGGAGEAAGEDLVELYLSRPYPCRLLLPDDEGGYLADHPDLPGCAAQGESAEEAVGELAIARQLWIESRLADGLPIPEPLPLEHTGIISLRMPSSLHHQLALDATRNGVSLNQLLNMVLAESVGSAARAAWRQAEPSTGTSPDPEHEIIQRAVPLLRQAFDGPGLKLLSQLPRNRADFLMGLMHLERRDFDTAFWSFSAAYYGGLNFMTVAVGIYRSLPERPPLRDLLGLLLELSHAIPSDTSERNEVYVLLQAWFNGVRDNPIGQEQWLRWGRARRKRAA